MKNVRDVQKLRVPLPINLKTTIVFRIAPDPDGWRSGHYVSGPGFFWDGPLAAAGPVYASAPEALHAEAAGVIRRLQGTSMQARIRDRVLAHIQGFLDSLPAEWPAPATAPLDRDKANVPQFPSLPPSTATDSTPAPVTIVQRAAPRTRPVPAADIPPPAPRPRRRVCLPMPKKASPGKILRKRMRRFWAER